VSSGSGWRYCSFWWKIASGKFASLILYVDGKRARSLLPYVSRASDARYKYTQLETIGWQRTVLPLSPGNHTIKFRFGRTNIARYTDDRFQGLFDAAFVDAWEETPLAGDVLGAITNASSSSSLELSTVDLSETTGGTWGLVGPDDSYDGVNGLTSGQIDVVHFAVGLLDDSTRALV
jgi:hypothetical protein